MSSIQKISIILLSAMAVLAPCPVSAAYSPEPIYTESEVYTNSREFLSHLLGDQPLTLAEYNKYFTHHSEFESQEDLAYCNTKWGESLSCDEKGKLTLKEDCKNFTRSKYMDKSSPSLFLARLRDILSGYGTDFSIDRVEPTRIGDIWSTFRVSASIGEKNIVLFHARTDLSRELGGLVRLVEIDGKDLWGIVAANYPEPVQCN